MKRRVHFFGSQWSLPFPLVFFGFLLLIPIVAIVPWLVTWNDATRPPIESVPISLTLPPGVSLSDLQVATVTDVIDGDTIYVNVDGKPQHIRYYGVDTPERGDACYREASDRNRTLVGKTVLLLTDARTTDDFGRTLRYIFTPDGVSIDATLVAEGFGEAWRQDGLYRDQIVALQQQAQDAQRGCLWKPGSKAALQITPTG